MSILSTSGRPGPSVRQLSDELRRFIDQSAAAQAGRPPPDLTVISVTLQRLKEQLVLSSSLRQNEFTLEFISPSHNGVELLIRVLAALQQQLHEAALQGGRLSNLIRRDSTLRRRKSGVAEADCLECLKLLLDRTPCWRIILQHVSHIETILISITSPQLDSKCYAMELAIMLLDHPNGFMGVYKALTALAGRKRDESRLTLVCAQMKHGLNTSKLHIQILATRLINKLVASAISPNHKIIIQCEAENGGFDYAGLDKIASTVGSPDDRLNLRRELTNWKNAYLPIGSGYPSSLKMMNGFHNGVIKPGLPHRVGQRQESFNGYGDWPGNDSDSTPRNGSDGGRRYLPQSKPRNMASSTAVAKEVERHKRRSSKTQFEDDRSDSEAVTDGEQHFFMRRPGAPLARNQSMISHPSRRYDDERFEPRNGHRAAPSRRIHSSEVPPSLRRRANSESALFSRASGIVENPLFSDGPSRTNSHRRPAPAARRPSPGLRRRGSSKRPSDSSTDYREHCSADELDDRPSSRERRPKAKSMHGLNVLSSDSQRRREVTIPIRRPAGGGGDVDEFGRPNLRESRRRYRSFEDLAGDEPRSLSRDNRPRAESRNGVAKPSYYRQQHAPTTSSDDYDSRTFPPAPTPTQLHRFQNGNGTRESSPARYFEQQERHYRDTTPLGRAPSHLNGHPESRRLGDRRQTQSVGPLGRSNTPVALKAERSFEPIDEELPPVENGHAPSERGVYRSRSDVGDRVKMKGFSYLFPNEPVVSDLPNKRSKTPQNFEAEVKITARSPSATNPGLPDRSRPDSVVSPLGRGMAASTTPVSFDVRNFDFDSYKAQFVPPPPDKIVYNGGSQGDSTQPSSLSSGASRPKTPVSIGAHPARIPEAYDGGMNGGTNGDSGHVVYIPVRMPDHGSKQDSLQKRCLKRTTQNGTYHLQPLNGSFHRKDSPGRLPSDEPYVVEKKGRDPKTGAIFYEREERAPNGGTYVYKYSTSSTKRVPSSVEDRQPTPNHLDYPRQLTSGEESSGGRRSVCRRRSTPTRERKISQDEVDDALRNFDYLNDYSIDEGHYSANAMRF